MVDASLQAGGEEMLSEGDEAVGQARVSAASRIQGQQQQQQRCEHALHTRARWSSIACHARGSSTPACVADLVLYASVCGSVCALLCVARCCVLLCGDVRCALLCGADVR